MAFEKSLDPPQATGAPPCIHLRSKAMYVTGQSEPNHPDEAGSNYCWCNQTQHILGPDQADVDRASCLPSRDCYRVSH